MTALVVYAFVQALLLAIHSVDFEIDSPPAFSIDIIFGSCVATQSTISGRARCQSASIEGRTWLAKSMLTCKSKSIG